MATLYLDRKGLELRVENETVTLREAGSIVKRIPLSLIERVVVTTDMTFSSSALKRLAARGAVMILVSRRKGDAVATVASGARPEAKRRIAQYEAFRAEEWRREWSRVLVRLKLRAQARTLGWILESEPPDSHRIGESSGLLRAASARLATETGLSRETLLGIEGSGAAAYFKGYCRWFAPSLRFTGRNRRPPRDPVNAVLSLGYVLLHHRAVTEILTRGLDPYLGFYHEPQHGRESLASDWIEPIRVLVDRLVARLFRERELRADHFRTQKGACLLGKTGRGVFYAAFDGESGRIDRYMRRASRLTLRALRPFLEEDDEEDLFLGDGDGDDEDAVRGGEPGNGDVAGRAVRDPGQAGAREPAVSVPAADEDRPEGDGDD